MTVAELLNDAARKLVEHGIHNGRQEAGWMLSTALDSTRITALPQVSGPLPPAVARRFAHILTRRLAGEPLQYILGTTEFYGLELVVGPGVLVPRPETECLVELAVRQYPGRGPVCDLCTGCGAVALALDANLPPGVPIDATDIAPDALAYAERNRAAHGATRVTFYRGDLFDPLPAERTYAVITANPPYVSARDYAQLPDEVRRYEPELALKADTDGLGVLRRIADSAPRRLMPGGRLLCEIGADQAHAAVRLCAAAGFADVTVHPDLTGRDRIVAAVLNPPSGTPP